MMIDECTTVSSGFWNNAKANALIRHIFIVPADFSPCNSQHAFQTYPIWIKRHMPLLDNVGILSADAVSRLIPTAVEQNRMRRENRDLEEIHAFFKTRIQRRLQMENRPINTTCALIAESGVSIENDA